MGWWLAIFASILQASRRSHALASNRRILCCIDVLAPSSRPCGRYTKALALIPQIPRACVPPSPLPRPDRLYLAIFASIWQAFRRSHPPASNRRIFSPVAALAPISRPCGRYTNALALIPQIPRACVPPSPLPRPDRLHLAIFASIWQASRRSHALASNRRILRCVAVLASSSRPCGRYTKTLALIPQTLRDAFHSRLFTTAIDSTLEKSHRFGKPSVAPTPLCQIGAFSVPSQLLHLFHGLAADIPRFGR